MTKLRGQAGINFTKLPDSVGYLNGMLEIENIFYTVGHQGVSTAFAEGKCSSKQKEPSTKMEKIAVKDMFSKSLGNNLKRHHFFPPQRQCAYKRGSVVVMKDHHLGEYAKNYNKYEINNEEVEVKINNEEVKVGINGEEVEIKQKYLIV